MRALKYRLCISIRVNRVADWITDGRRICGILIANLIKRDVAQRRCGEQLRRYRQSVIN